MMDWFRELPRAAKITMVCAILGWVVSLSFTTSASRNGVVTSCSHFNLGATAFGIAGIVTGAQAALASRRDRQLVSRAKTSALVIGVLGIAIGALHILRGFSVVGGPCN